MLLGNQPQANATAVTLVAQNAGEYAVKVTDDKGCFNTSPARRLTVNPLPPATITTPKNIVCEGKTLVLTANTGAGFRYEWRRDNLRVGEATQIHNAGETGSYSVVVTSAQNCSKTSEPVRIQQVKNPTVSVKAPANRICEGSTLSLTATSETAKLYQWLKDGQATTLEGTTLAVGQTGSYTVKVTDANECEAISTPYRVEVLTQIKLAIDSIPNLCGTAFDPIALQGSPVGGTFSGKGIVGGSFAPRVAGVGTHTLTYTVKGELECLSGTTTRNISIRPAPKVNIGADREIYRGSKIKLEAKMGTGYTYTWMPPKWIDDARLSRPTISPDSTTYYWVVAVGPDGCASEDSVKITVVQKIYAADAFSPNGDGINDTWDIIGLYEYPEAEVTVFSRWGNVVFYEKGSTQKSFDGTYKGEPLPGGVYTYTIKSKPDAPTERGFVMIVR
jgi:gliding motility-associated-like protein